MPSPGNQRPMVSRDERRPIGQSRGSRFRELIMPRRSRPFSRQRKGVCVEPRRLQAGRRLFHFVSRRLITFKSGHRYAERRMAAAIFSDKLVFYETSMPANSWPAFILSARLCRILNEMCSPAGHAGEYCQAAIPIIRAYSSPRAWRRLLGTGCLIFITSRRLCCRLVIFVMIGPLSGEMW